MKVKLKWSKDISVENDKLDEHHKKLFSIINKLITINNEDADFDSHFAILNELIQYSGYHFREEDAYMLDHEYPLFMPHRKEHQTYIQKMKEFVADFEGGNKRLAKDIIKFLVAWWQYHISESDVKYAKYIKANRKSSES